MKCPSLPLTIVGALLAMLFLCVPHRCEFFNAQPKSLWTNTGDFADLNLRNPSAYAEGVLRWKRCYYGLFWPFLTIDQGVDHGAWYVRFNYIVCGIYGLTAVLFGRVFYRMYRRFV